MDRRGIGALLLLLGVLAAVVLSRGGTRIVTGTPVIAPVPGPPQVGDCLTAPPPAGVTMAQVTPTEPGPASYPTSPLGPCTGTRYGEVAAVIADPAPTGRERCCDADGEMVPATGPADPAGGSLSDAYLQDPNADRCWQLAQSYVGMDPWPPAAADGLALGVAVSVLGVLTGPDTRQVSAGQHWAACLAVPIQSARLATVSFRLSLRDAIHTGANRDVLATCFAALGSPEAAGSTTMLGLSVQTNVAVVPCGRPHAGELLASGLAEGQVSLASAVAGCRAQSESYTGLADPTVGGRISLKTLITDVNGADVTSDPVPAQSSIACYLWTVGGADLNGSLLALRDRPVPWA